ncbi:MAG: hypothetical protein Q9195_004083 [Heterodermia aff. obscurata]
MASSYPPPPTTTSSSSQVSDAKRRRIQNSSSEGSDLAITPVSALNYTAERYRLGIPALPLLPLQGLPLPSYSPITAQFMNFEPRINQILREKDIEFQRHETEVVYRTLPGDSPSQDDATLVIYASWIDDDKAQSWYLAAHEIKSLLISASHTRSLKVEILSWHLTKPRVVDIVEASHPLVGAWPIVNSRIHEILEGFPRLNVGWKSIDALRIGYHSEDFTLPAPVTISITVDYGLNRRDWFRAEGLIKAMVDQINNYDLTDVQVEFERGEVDPSMAFPLIKPNRDGASHDIIFEDYPDRVSMGSSFGPDRYFKLNSNGPVLKGPTATIGGYLEIRSKGGDWKKYAITNYHCIRLAIDGHTFTQDKNGEPMEGPVRQDSELQKVDKSGSGPGRKEREKVTFESPSRRKHRFTVQWHGEQIVRFEGVLKDSPGSANVQQRLIKEREMRARKIQYFDQEKHRLGCLFMCSGYKQRLENNRIDLAVLEVRDTKMGNNTIPGAAAWPDSSDPPASEGRVLSGIASCKAESDLGSVFKFGSRTGGTTGKFSPIKSDIRMPWDGEPHVNMGYSTEYAFVAKPYTPPRPFLEQGDSGSFVFTDSGKWLGLAFAGCTKNGQVGGAVCYFTDAQVVLDWIGTRGDGYEVRLPRN